MSTTYRFVCISKLEKVEERKREEWVSGVAPNAPGAVARDVVTKTISEGWYVTTFGPSPQTFKIGDDNAIGLQAGMECRIALEVTVPDKPLQLIEANK